jgi:hypothetical protein
VVAVVTDEDVTVVVDEVGTDAVVDGEDDVRAVAVIAAGEAVAGLDATTTRTLGSFDVR